MPGDHSVGLSSEKFLLPHHTTVINFNRNRQLTRVVAKSLVLFAFSLRCLLNHFSPPARWLLSVPHPSHLAHAYPRFLAPIQKRRCSPRCGSWCRFSAVVPSHVAATSGSRSVMGSCCICARARQGWYYEIFGCAQEGSKLR